MNPGKDAAFKEYFISDSDAQYGDDTRYTITDDMQCSKTVYNN